jgi:hypothetical protein
MAEQTLGAMETAGRIQIAAKPAAANAATEEHVFRQIVRLHRVGKLNGSQTVIFIIITII